MTAVFPLARMTRDMSVLTGVALVLPLGLVGAALASPEPTRSILLAAVVLTALIYASVWLVWRPTRFEVDDGTLRIVWPLRSREIPRTSLGPARIVERAAFLREFGFGVRIGAGGLWGGFGLFKTRARTFSMWISRTDRVVLVEVAKARPLMITPDDPERFVATLG